MTKWLRVASFALVATAGACGDEDDEETCVDLCEDAQARDCTSIEGDCGEFCAALGSVQGPSGCTDERDQYQGCLEDDGVCGDCDDSEQQLTTCVGGYCAAHAADDDCQILIASF